MDEKERFYRLKLIWHRIRHGLILYSLRNLLLRIGLDIGPYYLELEGMDRCAEPPLRDDASLYQLSDVDDLIVLELYETLGWNTRELKATFELPHRCIGLYRDKDLAAFMVIQLQYFIIKGKRFELKENEAYLENMYTYESFRGKNIAPYLRYQSYNILHDQGRQVCYSVTEYFNRSSLNFKKKLNAKHLKLYLHLGFFRRYRWDILLKTYK